MTASTVAAGSQEVAVSSAYDEARASVDILPSRRQPPPFKPPQPKVPPVVVIPETVAPITTAQETEAGMILAGGFSLSTGAPLGAAPIVPIPPGSTAGPGAGQTGPADAAAPPVTAAVVKQPPRFRDLGIAIGDAVDVTPTDTVSFPLALQLTFDPLEAAAKGVDPELIRVFYFDEVAGTWSQQGITVTSIDRTDGVVGFQTTHLTVFRLGIPRSQPPLIHELLPDRVAPDGALAIWGRGFNPAASRNVLTLGGAFVSLSLDAGGDSQSLRLDDQGETLILRDANGHELDRAELSAAAAGGASWVRHPEALGASPFVVHTTIASGRLFSPGTHTDGTSFVPQQAAPARAPSAGDLVINEALLAPPASFLGDANGDGETNPQEDEFVELVNTTDHALVLDGVILVGRGGERHRFPAGTQLPGGMAWVLFGVDDPAHPPLPAGPFGGARFFPDTSAASRLIARVPPGTAAGTTFLTVTTLRQTSNPVSLQILSPLGDQLPAFEDASAHLPPLANRQLRVLRAADLDRDLDVDVVAVSRDAELSLLLNDGFGGFAVAADRITLPDGRNHFFDLALADLTADGAPELLIGDTDASGSYTQLLIFENTGGGAFSLLHQTGVLSGPASSGPTAFDLGDADGDGDLDVVVAIAGDQPIIFRNDGEARFAHLPGTDALPQEQVMVPTDLVLADMDDDGDADALLAAGRAGLGASRDVQLLLNDGAGRFEDATDSHLPSASDGVDALAVGDLDGDGDLDVVAGSQTRAPRLYGNDGAGRLTLREAGALAAVRASSVLLEDMDGDGDLDLVFSHPPRDRVFLNDGHAAFSALGPLPESPGNHREAAALDADGDGDLDLLSVGPGLTLLRNTGTRANHPPTIDAVADQSVIEGNPLSVNVTAHDTDGDALTLAAALASGQPLSTIGASFTDLGAGQGTLNWTPGSDQGLRGGRLYEIVVTARDGLASVQRTIRIFVHDFNHAPTLAAIAPQTVEELVPMSIQLEAQDQDADDVLTFGSVNQPSGSNLNSSSGLFQWMPGPTQGNGPQGFIDYPVTFTVTDLAHATDEEDVTIRVLHRNHAPVFSPISPRTVAEDQPLEFVVSASDPDGDAVTISDVDLPNGATFDDATRTFRWTPDFTQALAEPYLARFLATDQEFSTPLDVEITVLNTHVNQPPVLGALSNQTVLEGHLLQFAFPVSDPDGNSLTIRVNPLPRGARVFQQGQVWLFQWVPGMDQSRAYPVTVEVSDGIAGPVSGNMTITVLENPGFQRLVAQLGRVASDADPAATPAVDLGVMAFVSWTPGSSLVLDLGEVHPALVSSIDVFHSEPAMGLSEADLSLWVSDDNTAYQAYAGPKVVSAAGNRLMISNLNITQRYIKIHRLPASDPQLEVSNFLPEIVRASGAIPLDGPTTAFLDDLGEKTFRYFEKNVNANGLIPDRVSVINGQPSPGAVFSTGATGFWLASLPIAAERGWMTQADAQNAARRTLEFYLGEQGGPVEGHRGFYYHFLNGDGTRFDGFGDDGVSTIDSAILFMGALACGEYFRGDIETLATSLVNRADWEGFYDHGMNLLHQVWTPQLGFGRHIDYTSEGILAYLLAAGSTTHPILADPDLPGGGADAYYAYSRGNFGRILGRFGRDGRPLLQSFFGSLFTYLYPSLLVDVGGLRDAFSFNWEENAREAVLANFRFAQDHPEADYSRLYWGLSASDGPHGYQALYGAPPLDPGSGGVTHDGTVAPYAVAGSLAYAADLALPTLQHLASLQNGRLFDIYGLKSGVNVLQDFFDSEYLGIDQGALLLGLERYRTGRVAQLVRQSPVMQQALAALGLQSAPHLPLSISGPRSQHAYLIIDTSDHLTQTIQVARPALPASGDLLLELHPFGMDNARGDRFVDVELRVNGQFLKTVQFFDRRGTDVVDVGSVYVAVSPSLLAQDMNTIEFLWVGGERWVQLQDVELSGPTGRKGTQEFWQIGSLGTPSEFGDERRVNDSYLVGDNLTTLEQALNVVDEPITDLLFELQDPSVDRRLRLAAIDSRDGLPITVQITVNDASVGTVSLARGGEASASISHLLLRNGWNHIRLRHANVPTEGDFITWDMISFESEPGAGALQVLLRNVQGDQPAPQIQFGLAPPEGAFMSALQYLEIHYQVDQVSERVTISTDNRTAPIHRFTGPSNVSAAGLVGAVDSAITAPLLWQVYDARQPAAPSFTDTMEWAFVPDVSEPGFQTLGALEFRTLVGPNGLGDRPTPGRNATSPIAVYLVADFRGKPAQPYGTDRLLIEIIQQ